MVTIKEVAKKADVSVATVSRVLNNRGYLSESIKKKVNKAVKELHYTPNSAARSLTGKKLKLIGLVVPMINNPFYSELIQNIESLLVRSNYKVIICNSYNNAKKEINYLKLLTNNNVDGIITSSVNFSSDIKEAYRNLDIPIVSFDRQFDSKIPVVTSDNYNGGQLIGTLLKTTTSQKILFINTGKESQFDEQRLNGLRDLCESANVIPVSLPFIDTNIKIKEMNIKDCIIKYKPDSIVCSDDMTALIAMRICRQYDKRVPNDIQIVGYDGSKMIQNVWPELTTVIQPIKEIAHLLVDLLAKQINGQKLNKTEFILPTDIHIGTTTK